MAILKQNVAIALLAKLVFLLLGVTGAATLWMAIVADDGVSLLVIFNSLRLLRFPDPR
jgi:Cd2+/Zn2+-exporting ATPase